MDDMTLLGIKAAVAAGVAALTAVWGWFGWLVVAWVVCMLLDYGTGTAAALRAGETTAIVNAARLRMKESDRLRTTAALLAALGGRAEEGPDFLTVQGGPLAGGTVDSANDHRIAMAAAIAATACTGPVTIRGAECVQKSYPDFWEVYRSLGGDIHVL